MRVGWGGMGWGGVTHKGCIQCCHSTIAVRSSAAHLPSFRGPQESQDSLLLLLLREGPAGILAEVHLQQGVVHHRAAVRDVLRRGREAKGSWYTQFQLYVSLPQVQMHINDVVGSCYNVHLNGVLLSSQGANYKETFGLESLCESQAILLMKTLKVETSHCSR